MYSKLNVIRVKKEELVFAVFVLAIIAYHTFGYIGHYGYDDLNYAKLANNFKNGVFDYNDHFSYRITLILLTAMSYALFGVSDFASSLPAIFISIFVLFFVFIALKEKGTKTLVIGLSLTTFSHWFIFYSDKLMPDVYVALAVFSALYFIHQYRYCEKNKNQIVYPVLLNLSLLFGFMSKGTIILILPLLLYYFFIDVLQKRHIQFWMLTIAFGVLLLSIYFLGIKILTGDFLKRFEIIEKNSYINLCSYSKQPVKILLHRVFPDFFKLLLHQGMAVGFIFLLPYLVRKKH